MRDDTWEVEEKQIPVYLAFSQEAKKAADLFVFCHVYSSAWGHGLPAIDHTPPPPPIICLR